MLDDGAIDDARILAEPAVDDADPARGAAAQQL